MMVFLSSKYLSIDITCFITYRITDIWNKFEFDSKILCELAIMIGSIAQGLPMPVRTL